MIQRCAVLLVLFLLILSGPGWATEGSTATVTTIATFESGTGGLTVAPDGTLYHSDFGSMLGGRGTGGHRVFKVTPKGEVSVFATGLRGASGSEWGHDGYLYQSNVRGNTLSRIDSEGNLTTVTSTGLTSPVGVAQEPSAQGKPGDFLVANCGAASIQRVSADGSSEEWVKSNLLACPNGLVIGDAGNVYAANFMNGNVVQISPDGKASVLATAPGNNNGHLFYRHGALWLVARSAHQIYKIDLSKESRGEMTLIAGSGEKGGKDGAALDASFCYPNDLGFSPDGRYLYVNEVADSASTGQLLSPSRIRRIDLRGRP